MTGLKAKVSGLWSVTTWKVWPSRKSLMDRQPKVNDRKYCILFQRVWEKNEIGLLQWQTRGDPGEPPFIRPFRISKLYYYLYKHHPAQPHRSSPLREWSLTVWQSSGRWMDISDRKWACPTARVGVVFKRSYRGLVYRTPFYWILLRWYIAEELNNGWIRSVR